MIQLTDNLEINKPAPVDDRLGIFESTAEALAYTNEDRRYVGLTVIVDDGSGATEYWFKDGVTNADLEAKSIGGGSAWGSITGTLSNQTDLQTALDAKANTSSLATVATSGSYNDLTNKPTIPNAQVNSDWNSTSGVSEILNKPTIPSISGLVPYTGATQDLNLGTHNVIADQLALNVSPTGTLAVGMTEWNDTIGSSQTLLKGGSVTLKNGVDLVARVVNKVSPNTTLTKANYQVVKVAGAQGQRLAVDLARANTDLNSADTLGVVTETIATNQEGFILTVGQIEGINTTGSLQGETWADGDVLYLSPTTAGRMTNVKPNGSTGHIVVIGYVEYSHVNNGKIYVKIMNGWELDELHNVYINPGTLANGDALIYESSTDLWKNKVIDISASQMTSGTLNKARLPKVIPAVAIAGSAGISGAVTTEVVLQTLTIPGGTLNVGDVIRISGIYSYTTTGTKTPRVKFGTTTGGTAILQPPGAIGASITSTQVELYAIVTSSTNLRFILNNTTNALIFSTNTGAMNNITIDRAVANSFVFTVQKGTAGDTAVCETAFLEIITS
jgi:nitrogen fixation protein